MKYFYFYCQSIFPHIYRTSTFILQSRGFFSCNQLTVTNTIRHRSTMVCTSVTNDSVGSAREAPPTGEGMMSDTQGSHATDE